jgi:hypothetical protein
LIASLGKGAESRLYAEIFDEAGVVPVDSRTEPGTQEIQLYDVIQLAHHYGVSPLSALYRLRNLKLLSESEFERLKKMDSEGRSRTIGNLLGFPQLELTEQRGEFQRRFLSLGLEALRREKISQSKFFELAERVNVQRFVAQGLLDNAGIDDGEPEPVLLPER